MITADFNIAFHPFVSSYKRINFIRYYFSYVYNSIYKTNG